MQTLSPILPKQSKHGVPQKKKARLKYCMSSLWRIYISPWSNSWLEATGKKNNINRTPSFGQHKPQVRMNFVTHLPMVTSLNLDIFFFGYRISLIAGEPSFFGTAGTLGVSWTRFPPVPLVPLDMSANSGLPGHIGDLLRIEGNFQQLLPIFVDKPVKSNDMKKKDRLKINHRLVSCN